MSTRENVEGKNVEKADSDSIDQENFYFIQLKGKGRQRLADENQQEN